MASNNGTVRQFVAMPLQEGYSVEYQITGEDVVGGIQLEITPCVEYQMAIPIFQANDEPFYTGSLNISNRMTIGMLKKKLRDDPNIQFGRLDELALHGEMNTTDNICIGPVRGRILSHLADRQRVTAGVVH
jgi:hypothetical protein